MDPERLQASAARDQLWASLRALTAEIARLAAGEFAGSERERQVVQLLARIVEARLHEHRAALLLQRLLGQPGRTVGGTNGGEGGQRQHQGSASRRKR